MNMLRGKKKKNTENKAKQTEMWTQVTDKKYLVLYSLNFLLFQHQEVTNVFPREWNDGMKTLITNI